MHDIARYFEHGFSHALADIDNGFTFAADDQLTNGFLVASYSLSAKPKRGGIFTSLHVSQDEVERIMNAHATHFLLDKPRRQLTVSSSYMRRVTS